MESSTSLSITSYANGHPSVSKSVKNQRSLEFLKGSGLAGEEGKKASAFLRHDCGRREAY